MLPGGPRFIAFGHSWVAGRHPSRWVTPWPRRVALRLGRPLVNGGAGGAESPQVAERLLAAAPRAGDVVAIEAMLNDVRGHGPSAEAVDRYCGSLERMLAFLERSPAAEVIVLADPPIPGWHRGAPFDRGSDAARELYAAATGGAVAKFSRARVVDLAADWTADHMAADEVHPNAAGTRQIARAVLAALARR